jgi:hypothetical protein
MNGEAAPLAEGADEGKFVKIPLPARREGSGVGTSMKGRTFSGDAPTPGPSCVQEEGEAYCTRFALNPFFFSIFWTESAPAK